VIRRTAIVSAALLMGCAGAWAEDVPSGKAVFDQHCSVCHAPGLSHPGTMRLAQTRGADRAALEQRADLDPEYIRRVVREGLIEMPPWRRTEIDDAALDQLVRYLARRRR
jgi:mono/diheme cytochrome c family protein